MGTGDGTASAGATVGGTATVDSNGMMTSWSKSIIDRPITVLKGKIGASADLQILHFSVTAGTVTASATSEGLGIGGAYGVSDKLEIGATYAFALHDFQIKGPLDLYGGLQLSHSAKLDVGAGADLEIRLGDTTTEAIHAGLAVRYKVAPKFAIISGNPHAPGPLGQHLTIGLNSGAAKTFAFPVGVEIQATPELYAFATTSIGTLLLSDPGPGGSRFQSIADATPLVLGAFFNVNKNIDVGGSLNFIDLQHAGDFYGISLGLRYYN